VRNRVGQDGSPISWPSAWHATSVAKMTRSAARSPSLSFREFFCFGEAAILLAAAVVGVRLLPFRWLISTATWGGPAHTANERRGDLVSSKITRAVARASRRLPWRSVCIHRGLAVHWMARRRGLDARFHYGLSQDNSLLSAHVWVSVNGRIIEGQDEAANYTCVAQFPA
jgi:hypothetical protein